MLISELPNTPDYPLRTLAELRRKENTDPVYGTQKTWNTGDAFDWHSTGETHSFWNRVFNAKHRPDIPAASIEDLRRAGMMPEPEPVIKDFARIDTAPPPFYCIDGESDKKHLVRCYRQCIFCKSCESDKSKPKPSITLEDYARMEREHEAITNPAHYKVCEGLEVVDMIRAVLTPEQFRGYCLGNLIKYRMRAGKKTMSPMEDLGKAHVYEQWLAEMEGGEQ